MRRMRLSALLLAAVWLLQAGRPLTSAPQTGDDWYVLRIAGKNVGYLHQKTEKVSREGRIGYRTLAESRMVMERLGAGLEVTSRAEYLETEGGDLLEVSSELGLSRMPVKAEARVSNGRILLKSRLGGAAEQEREIPFTGRLLGPEGMRMIVGEELKEPGDTVSLQSFLPEFSQLVKVTMTLDALEPLPESRPPRPSLRVTESYSGFPQNRTVWLDRQGRTLLSSDASAFGELVTVLAGREEALAAASAENAAELPFQETLARSNIRLPQARLIESVILRLERKMDAGNGVWPDFNGPGQSVLQKSPGHLVLKVERPKPAASRTAAISAEGERFRDGLQPNPFLNTQDEALRDAVSEALGKGGKTLDPLRRALRLKRWVGSHMRFDLGIAFAPSSEVVRNLRGTCAEYAVLLAAMLRAAGIPSRLLMGYVYLNGIWGGHAWSEAFIGGSWLPLDAAVYGPGIADAARFALTRSTLNDGLGELVSGGQMLMGNLEVTVLSYTLAGKKVPVVSGAPPYLVLGDYYLNGGLGMGVRKPRGFVFEDLDKTWPQDVFLTMRDPRGRVIRILQDAWRPGDDVRETVFRRLEELVPGARRSSRAVAGRNVPLVTAEGRAAAAVVNGADVWLITVEGEDAAGLLASVLGSFRAGEPFPVPREVRYP